ncbi:hypothetical protein Ahy_A03g012209 [Arachis hypogaea]|uniref:Protein FAR1-RELATED SEQUENCE n=1 Tax=Arachis hypogaea TaxID=3818 RepID=A0A445DSY3_ARAHY|nr:hypothetical protein Ahy_A03g012209 [Arachis hypogaea]
MKTFVQDHNHDLALPAFINVMPAHRNINEEEFDQYWSDMVAAFGLEENEWIWTTYDKRVHQANAYLCDNFCAGLRMTSRCKGINALLKRFFKSLNCLLELVENLERVVKVYRNNEFIVDYKSLYSEPVMTTGLESIERAMWRKDAKSGSFHDSDGGFEHNREFRGRYGSFWSACLPMCLLEAQWSTTYEYAVVKIAQLLKEVEVEVSKDNSSTFEHTTADGCGILDLKIINSKSAPRSSINGKMGRR